MRVLLTPLGTSAPNDESFHITAKNNNYINNFLNDIYQQGSETEKTHARLRDVRKVSV